MRQAFILRVGANLKENKGLSPIFKDKTYEYIPSVLDKNFNTSKHHNHKHYSKLNCQNKNLSEMHMSSFVEEDTGHVDPEFYSFTYGETRSSYLSVLKKLNPNDILAFSIILQKYETKSDNFILKGEPEEYIFGYFIIESTEGSVLEIKGLVTNDNAGIFISSCNEHIIYKDQHIQTPENKKLLLLQGDKHNSLMYHIPLKIGNEEGLMAKYKQAWKISNVNDKEDFYSCEKVDHLEKDLKAHSEANRWTEWTIP